MKRKAGIDEIEYLLEACSTPMRSVLFMRYLVEQFEFTEEVVSIGIKELMKNPSESFEADEECTQILIENLPTPLKLNR
jgi:hypothetical protein